MRNFESEIVFLSIGTMSWSHKPFTINGVSEDHDVSKRQTEPHEEIKYARDGGVVLYLAKYNPNFCGW